MVSPVVGPTGWPMGGQGWEARTNGRAGQQRAITPLEGRGNVAQLNSAGGIYVLWGKGLRLSFLRLGLGEEGGGARGSHEISLHTLESSSPARVPPLYL